MDEANNTIIHVEQMSRSEFLGKVKKLVISYSVVTVPLGRFLVASTSKGICYLMPAAMKWSPVEVLKAHFPKARFRCQKVSIHKSAALLLKQRFDKVKQISLHLYGTDFQLSVWKDLLAIPMGKVTTYLNIAKRIGRPRAARPVGQAVSSNPVIYIIPCHRVICSNGKIGGYRWDVSRKIKFLNKEAQMSYCKEGLSNWEPTFF